jgi:CO dehydrogenase maturation factor
MKVAFVGKGGSGKSTVSAQFINHLISEEQQVLAIDADINQHLAGMVGAELSPEKALYYQNNSIEVRTILRGTNERIESAKRFVKTTPPGKGSHVIHLRDNDSILAKFATKFAGDNYFLHAGTYDRDGIGVSCYHSNLAVVENVLSHTVTSDKQWLVADMVAGTDAFAGALHIMFDAIFMVVEPTPESVGVFMQFHDLAREAEVDTIVFAVGNKVMDDDDAEYLRAALGDKLVTYLPHDAQLRKARQRGESLQHLSTQSREQMGTIAQVARDNQPDADTQLRKLHVMHKRFAAQDFTIAKHGDITAQVDEAFSLRPSKD